MLFKRKAKGMTVQEIATVLALTFKESLETNAKALASTLVDVIGPPLPPNLEDEIEFLLFISLDFAMSAGPEKELRNQLRDCFISLNPLDKRPLQQLAERADEYAAVIRQIKDSDNRQLKVGKVLATHIGYGEDSFVAISAGIAFDNYAGAMAPLISSWLRKIEK